MQTHTESTYFTGFVHQHFRLIFFNSASFTFSVVIYLVSLTHASDKM